MPPWISAGGVAPLLQVVAEMVQRVAVLGEDEQLAAAVLELVELGPLEAFLQGGQFGVARAWSRTRRALGEQFLQRGDFGAQLVELDGGGELVGELVALGLVQIVFVLLGVVQMRP